MPADDGALSAEVLDRLDSMTGALATVAGQLEKVAARERRTRLLAMGMLASFVLDIVLTVLVTVLSVNALSQASAVHQAQLAACASSNQIRAEQIMLWNYVVQLSSQSPNSNPAALHKFEAFVRKTFAPVDCAKIYR